MYLVTTQTCGLTTQLYLIWRVSKISKNNLYLVGFLVLCALLAWSSAIATMVALQVGQEPAELITYVNLWLITSAGRFV